MARPDFPHVVDNSLIAAFKACPQKAYKEYFQHWKSKIPSIHLHAGAAFAHGLEHARVAFYEEGSWLSALIGVLGVVLIAAWCAINGGC